MTQQQSTSFKNSKSLNKTIYDNAKTHFLGNFPANIPIENAYTHIGMFLGWMIENDLYSEYFEEEAEVQMYRFKKRELGPTILSEIWDGYLGYELFSKTGNMFTYYYYGSGIYNKDYTNLLAKELPSIYHVKDTWENYALMANQISNRHKQWEELIK